MKQVKSITELEKIKNKFIKKQSGKKTTVVVSAGTCGLARGSAKVIKAFQKQITAQKLKKELEVKITGCHGFCEVEPNIIIYPQGIFYQKLVPEDVNEVISETILGGKIIDRLLFQDPQSKEKCSYAAEIPYYKKQNRLLMANNAMVDPVKIEDYIGIGGYAALAKALIELTPEKVVASVKQSGLRGRGGGGFPTGRKWEICSKASSNGKYIICNADEGDPGAYMDRSLLEGNPHSVIEGMIIGAFGIGATRGYVYVRDEYPLAVNNLGIAIEQAREYGFLGENILGTNFSFDIIIAKGSGAFVCGEETALIASIEGRRGIPRQRPPFPAFKGLWGKPTNINNVETWANIPVIINNGADWYAKIGTEGSKGTKIFSLVGKINNTGLVEVPMGITLREIIYDIGGGIPGEKKFKAVQTGGPSGGCIPSELIDLPVDYESLTKAGSIMGSGGMIVMDENTCMVDVAKYFLNFLRDESCGKCVSCREGTQRMWEIVNDVTAGAAKPEDIELLEELSTAVKDASLCGLGQTAANPVRSTLRYFKQEYEAHIHQKKCPAMVCKEIVSSPCQYICPADQEACVYIALIAHGEFEKALEVIRKDNPFAAACGRACDHACETVCKAGEYGDPIGIRSLKRFVTDWAMKNGIQSNHKAAQKRNEKIAVIGAGPGGLSAAYFLARDGYPVTVFEKLPVAGGMLAVGIPDHRLPKKMLQWDLDNIINQGVEIKTNMELGKNFTLDDLSYQGYKAVFIAIGAHKSMKMNVPGEDAAGVIQALKLLKDVNLGNASNLGKSVAIVGGGNAAVDAARVAIRDKNVEKVTILYRRTRHEMPAYREEIEAALEEGVILEELVLPVKVLVENGKMKGLECIRMKLGDMDESGRRKPVPVEGSEFTMALDNLILAIGERADTAYLAEKEKFGVTKWGTLTVNEEIYATDESGVYAGGDVVTGPKSIIAAVGAGKIAAQSIAKYVQKQKVTRDYTLTRPSMFVEPIELTEEESAKNKRPPDRRLTIDQRIHNFDEVELGMTEQEAIAEAKRCLRCELETKDAKAFFQQNLEKNQTQKHKL